jgi:hypothetical protein
MKSIIKLTILTFCLILCGGVTSYAQDKISVSDIKGIWISSLFYSESKGDYEVIPREDSVGFGFTEGKGMFNQARYTGLYGIIDGGRPKLLYYSLENNKVHFYDSSDNPLSYFLVIESVIPRVSMTATLFQENGDKTIGSKMKFLYYEKNK